MSQPISSVPPPPNYDVTAEEFANLKALGTGEAMAMFLARNPEHPLAAEALASLRSRALDMNAAPAIDTPDSLLYRAFAHAAAIHSPQSYAVFAAQYPGHPLAVLAERLARSP